MTASEPAGSPPSEPAGSPPTGAVVPSPAGPVVPSPAGVAGPPWDIASGAAPHGPVPPYGPPPPPPGPGVVPPFAAPPTEGRAIRIWLGIGTAALGVLLCCGGGTGAIVGLAVAGTQAVKEQARAVVGDYLDAVSHDDLGQAYALLCDEAQRRESRSQFEQRVAAQPDIATYKLGTVRLTNNDVSVPAEISYAGGGQDSRLFHLVQDSNTGTPEVCGIS